MGSHHGIMQILSISSIVLRIEADMINPALNDVPFGLGYVLYNLVVCLLGFICWADRWDIFIPFSQELVGISRHTGARLGKVRWQSTVTVFVFSRKDDREGF